MNNLPSRYKYFVGRADILMDIQETLKNGLSALVTGLGGFGKTQTAIEYAFRHVSEYEYIWCFNAESEARLENDYREFAERIGLPAESASDFRRVNLYISDWFKSKKCLFIYDNAEGCDCKKLSEYLPLGHSGSHIIINSREYLHDIAGKKLDMTVFSIDDAITFIKNRIEHVNDGDAEKISHRLEYLPLALEQAVSYMNKNYCTCEQYLELLLCNSLRLLDSPSTDTDYIETVMSTWLITFRKLESDALKDQLSKAAVQLLKLCAYCAPDDIPLRMFIDGREQLPPPLRGMLDPGNEPGHIELIGKLKNHSIVSVRWNNGEALLTIHRLIQAVVSRNMQDALWLPVCLYLAVTVFKYQYGDKQSFDKFAATLPHALEIAKHTESVFRGDDENLEKVAKLYHEAGMGLKNIGDYAKALEWYQKAQVIYEKALGKEHPDTAETYNNIALIYTHQGNYAKALEWNEKVLKIREKILGALHPDTTATYNNIAIAYYYQGDFTKALEWNFKALNIKERVLEKYHPSIATTYNNIAFIYSDLSDYAKSLEWYRKALYINKKVFGTEHPSTAKTYNNIALVYTYKGDYADALELYRKALAVREKILGLEHPETATTYNNIALVYTNKGDYADALELYRKALTVREKVLGLEHPETAETYGNIAFLYKNQGDYTRALKWYQKALFIREKVLGKEHPETIKTNSSIASISGHIPT